MWHLDPKEAAVFSDLKVYGTYKDGTTNTLETANRISVTDPDPDRNGWKHYPLVVSYVHRKSLRAAAVVDAVFSDVTIKNGYSLLVDGTKHGSVVSCRAVQTTAPRELLDRGTNGWLGENTMVLHSTIQAAGD